MRIRIFSLPFTLNCFNLSSVTKVHNKPFSPLFVLDMYRMQIPRYCCMPFLPTLSTLFFLMCVSETENSHRYFKLASFKRQATYLLHSNDLRHFCGIHSLACSLISAEWICNNNNKKQIEFLRRKLYNSLKFSVSFMQTYTHKYTLTHKHMRTLGLLMMHKHGRLQCKFIQCIWIVEYRLEK
jgi:hypothetical protein